MSDFRVALDFVLEHEGGLSMNPNDPGNWTGGAKGEGTLRGTKFGISAASYPNVNIAKLTREQAADIYLSDYWRAAGCPALSFPKNVLVFDTAVQHGVGRAKRWAVEHVDLWAFYGHRLRFYTRLSSFYPRFDGNGRKLPGYGRGWTARMADLASLLSDSAEYYGGVDAVVINRPLARRIYDAFEPVIRRRQVIHVRKLALGEGWKVDIRDGEP